MVDESLIDDTLTEQMALVRRIVELGRAARATSSVRTRQPLSRALVSAPGWVDLPDDLVEEVASELNVATLLPLADEAGDLVDLTVKANFRSLGARFGSSTPTVAAAITADPDLARRIRDKEEATLEVEGLGTIVLEPDDVVITETPREGWAVASGHGETVALDLHITDALRRLGLAREAVRAIAEMRKSAGLDISDRIRLRWSADDPDLVQALLDHGDYIAAEVLATDFDRGTSSEADHVDEDAELGLQVSLSRI